MKNIYITWHYTTHGVAYLKHILSWFYQCEKLQSEKLDINRLEQEELNSTFDIPKRNGFVFDEIVYLTAPQLVFDKLSSRRFSYKKTIFEDDLVQRHGLKELFEEIISNDEICYDLEAEFSYVKKKHPKKFKLFEQVVWRNIQHYPIEMQIKWLTEYSNFKNIYAGKFKVIELNVNDLRDEKQISDEVSKWSRQYFSKQKDFQPIINVSLGSNETQVVWHILSEAGQLPHNTRFIKTYDDKSDKLEKRFKQFSILEIQTNLISAIGTEFKLYSETKSPSRKLVNKKMETFLKSGFSILLIGERGIGKSKIASEAKQSFNRKNPFVEANCASFDEDSKAEAELFGYEKGAFTGANATKKGLLEEADEGVLFLDEIHHLSKLVQAKLMKAFQTDKNNKMSIRRMGSNKELKVECRLIFATNKNVAELRNELLPDFYDRIVQHVVNIPAIRETVEDRFKDWENVWKGLNFSTDVPKDLDFVAWLKQLPLYGNFRDLQKIAIYYNAYNQFDEETRMMLDESNAFQYAKNEFEKYHSFQANPKNDDTLFKFSFEKNALEIEADFKCHLQDWAAKRFGSRKEAAKQLGVSEKALNDWKNRKSLSSRK
jgi:transcriptional regulator with AAA-type ATPase domain